MFQESTRKWWFPATITSLCSEPRSYKIATKEGVTYRKTQAHLKPYSPKHKKVKMNIVYCNLVICGQLIARSVTQLIIKQNLIEEQRGTLSPQFNLNCNVLCGYSINKFDLACYMWLQQKVTTK